MIKDLPGLDEMPRQNASQVKNKWGDVTRLVQKSGSVAITNHSAVEMVLLNAATYRQLTEEIAALNTREQAVLTELANRFEERLSLLRQPAAGNKVKALLATRGKLPRRSRAKAGASY